MSSRRSRSGGGGHGDGGEERWLLPYADMITLLLGLFIVLFAMSSIDAKKFDNIRSSLAKTFDGGQVLEEPGGVLPGSDNVLDPTNPTDSAVSAQAAARKSSQAAEDRFDKEKQQIEKAIESKLGNDVKVTRNQIGIKVSLAGDALFESGEYNLKESVRDDLRSLERQLEKFSHPIEITGHTDGAAFDGEFGNYGLAFNRALSVHALFIEFGYPPARMKPSSRGDLDPVKPPKYKGEGVAANRRIEITILEPGALDGFTNGENPAKVQSAKQQAEARASISADLAELDAAGELIEMTGSGL